MSSNFVMPRGTTQAFLGFAKYQGNGITLVPHVTITGDGNGANYLAVVSGGFVVGFTPQSVGTGYTTATVTVGNGLLNVQADATIGTGGTITALTVRPVDLSALGTDIIILYKLTNCPNDLDEDALIACTLLNGRVTLPNGGADGFFRWQLEYADTAPDQNDLLPDTGDDVVLDWTTRGVLPNTPTNSVYDLGGGTLRLQQGAVRKAA